MYKPKLTPISHLLHFENKDVLPNYFGLLTWNLHKVDFSHFIHRPIEQLLPIDPPHLLSLQEATARESQHKFFNLPFIMAPNIQTKKKHFGVLTASAFEMRAHHQCLTQSRELGWMTHKTALITEHPLQNGETLIHVNIHAINFVSHGAFRKELQLIWHLLSEKKGPMILSGDFNTWNKTRVKTLNTAIKQLNLTEVHYPTHNAIKTLNWQPLDYVFYRGLSVEKSQALDVPEISDHNPLIVHFSVLP